MAEDSTSPDKLKQLDERLNYLESVARETVARLYAVEKHLGLVFKAVPKHLDQPSPVDDQARDSRLRAVEEALKTVPPIATQEGHPAEEVKQKTPADQPPPVKPPALEIQTPVLPHTKAPEESVDQIAPVTP